MTGPQEDKGEKMGARASWSRTQVVQAIGQGTTFVTLLKNSHNNLERGTAVKRDPVDGEWFVKTVSELNGKCSPCGA